MISLIVNIKVKPGRESEYETISREFGQYVEANRPGNILFRTYPTDDPVIAVIGCDGISDVVPSRVANKPNPLHELVLVGMGMLILDNLALDELAREAKARGRWEFLFVGAPLRVPGGTGSPLNPLAVF